MADLREVASCAGLHNVQTYLASGNLIFDAEGPSDAIAEELERRIEERFGFAVDVIVRSQQEWHEYRLSNPFKQEGDREPNLVMLGVGKTPASEADVAKLRSQANEDECVERRGDVIWLYFGNGVVRSKIAPGKIQPACTTRNWRTVLALDKMMN